MFNNRFFYCFRTVGTNKQVSKNQKQLPNVAENSSRNWLTQTTTIAGSLI